MILFYYQMNRVLFRQQTEESLATIQSSDQQSDVMTELTNQREWWVN